MSDLITVQGVVISAMPVGEYDKRIVLLTRERGKDIGFCQRSQKSEQAPLWRRLIRLSSVIFTLYEGRTSYNLNQVSVTHHFVELAPCSREFTTVIISLSWRTISAVKEQMRER